MLTKAKGCVELHTVSRESATLLDDINEFRTLLQAKKEVLIEDLAWEIAEVARPGRKPLLSNTEVAVHAELLSCMTKCGIHCSARQIQVWKMHPFASLKWTNQYSHVVYMQEAVETQGSRWKQLPRISCRHLRTDKLGKSKLFLYSEPPTNNSPVASLRRRLQTVLQWPRRTTLMNWLP